MGWTAPRTWVTGEVVTAALLNTHVRDNLLDVDRRATAVASSVLTSQTTGSTTFADLATVGPAVTVTTGTAALVILQCSILNTVTTNYGAMAAAISGATTLAAADALSVGLLSTSTSLAMKACAAYFYSSLTAGSNTFTAKYRVSAGTGTFLERYLTVIPLKSA